MKKQTDECNLDDLVEEVGKNITDAELNLTRENIKKLRGKNGELLEDSLCMSGGGLVMIAYD